MKKRIFATLLAAVMALSALVVVPVGADYTSGDWGYTVSDGEATINRYYGSDTEVTIPSTIDGYPVTGLSCWYNSIYCGIFYGKSTKSVTIPDGVTTIGVWAFSGCSSLTSVTIPDSVTTIGGSAFGGCTSLTSVTIPDSVTEIDWNAFESCTSLTSVTIPDSVTTIGSEAFSNTALYNNSANWENNVLYIGHHLIGAKTGITGSYSIKPGTLTIGERAFYNCTSLEMTIPDSVTSIGNYAFSDCSKLNTVYYTGSQTQWNAISIGSNNDPLKNATKVYNYDPHVHDYSAVVTPATCTAKGYTTYTCSGCGDVYVANEVPALGHSFGEWTVTTPATCTAQGEERRVCSNDPSHIETRAISALGHDFGEWTVTTPASCTIAGVETRVCSRDPSHIETRTLAKLPHTPGEAVTENLVEAVCEAAGSYDSVVYCTECGTELSRETVTLPALGHSWSDWDVFKAPNCETQGTEYRFCYHDGTHFEFRAIPALGHTPGEAVEENRVEAKCESAGSYDIAVYCTVCGKEISRRTVVIPALGHDFGEWTVTTPRPASKRVWRLAYALTIRPTLKRARSRS